MTAFKKTSRKKRKSVEVKDSGMTERVEESLDCSVFGGVHEEEATGPDSERHPGIRPHQQQRDLWSDTMTSGIRSGWIYGGIYRQRSNSYIHGASCVNAVAGRRKITHSPTQVTGSLLHQAFKR